MGLRCILRCAKKACFKARFALPACALLHRAALRRIMVRPGCRMIPLLCGSAYKNKGKGGDITSCSAARCSSLTPPLSPSRGSGVQPLLDAVVAYLPSPLDRPSPLAHLPRPSAAAATQGAQSAKASARSAKASAASLKQAAKNAAEAAPKVGSVACYRGERCSRDGACAVRV
jgi:hypothetical protein